VTEQALPTSPTSPTSPVGATNPAGAAGGRRRGSGRRPGPRRLLGAALSALILAGTATACASGTQVAAPGSGGGGADSTASHGASPTGRSLQPGGPPLGGSSSAAPVGHSVKAGSYHASANRITVYFIAGVCERYGLRTDESHSGQVRVDVAVTKAPPKGQMCPSLERMQSLDATLRSPLGSRSVVDASNGKHLPVHPELNGTAGAKATHGPVSQ
jgi:hypothetical protein